MVVNTLNFIKYIYFFFFLWTVLLLSYHILIIFVPSFNASKWLSNAVEDEVMTQ